MKQIIISIIDLYQKTISPDHGWFKGLHPAGYCRYYPTCSQYAKESVSTHGVLRGSFLSIARVSRCHPWAPFGEDPVLSKESN